MLKSSISRVKANFSLSKFSKFRFTQDLTMPIIDFDKFLNKSQGWEAECKLTADCLHDTGILCVKENVRKAY